MPNKTLSLVNVNLPKTEGHPVDRQSVRHYDGKVVPDKDPMGRLDFLVYGDSAGRCRERDGPLGNRAQLGVDYTVASGSD